MKLCPKCGKTLVERNGSRGAFLACPGYPACKHSEPLEGSSSTGGSAVVKPSFNDNVWNSAVMTALRSEVAAKTVDEIIEAAHGIYLKMMARLAK